MNKKIPLEIHNLYGGKISPIVIVIIVLLILGGIGVGIYFAVKGDSTGEETSEEQTSEEETSEGQTSEGQTSEEETRPFVEIQIASDVPTVSEYQDVCGNDYITGQFAMSGDNVLCDQNALYIENIVNDWVGIDNSKLVHCVLDGNWSTIYYCTPGN